MTHHASQGRYQPAQGSTETPTGAQGSPLPPLLLTTDEASQTLRLSVRKLGELTRIGAVPSKKIGRRVCYSRAELARWIELDCPTDPGSWEQRGAA